MRSKTAMHRNFVRTPCWIAGMAGATLTVFPSWLGIVFGVDRLALIWLMLIGVVMGVACTYQLSRALVNARVLAWADEYHGIHEADLAEWLDSMEEDELDQLIAIDLEGPMDIE